MFGSSQKWRRNIDRIDRKMNHLFKVILPQRSQALQEGFEGLFVAIFSCSPLSKWKYKQLNFCVEAGPFESSLESFETSLVKILKIIK